MNELTKYRRIMSKRFEVIAGNCVAKVIKKYYHILDLEIPKPPHKDLQFDYDYIQIDNLLVDIDNRIPILVDAKLREGISYGFTKWSNQAKAIYLKRYGHPPKEYFWVNSINPSEIYISGEKQYREFHRQFLMQKEFLIKTPKSWFEKITSNKGLSCGIISEIYDIIGEGNFRMILFVNDLRTGNKYNTRKILYSKVRDILILSCRHDYTYTESEIKVIKHFIRYG